MKFTRIKGSTSNILLVFIMDSSSTTGAGLTSLDENSNIVGGQVREGGVGIALTVDENVATEGTYQAPTTASQIRIGTPANMRPGVYELHVHDDLFASGAEILTIVLGGATNMADLPLEIQLVDDLVIQIRDVILSDSTAFDGADIAALIIAATALLAGQAEIKGSGFVEADDSLEALSNAIDVIPPGGDTISVIAFPGQFVSSFSMRGEKIEYPRRTENSIPYDFGSNIAGMTINFMAKLKQADSDASAAIALKDITSSVTDAASGLGLIPLTEDESNIDENKYYAEVQAVSAGKVVQRWFFTLSIIHNVVDGA